MIISISIIAWGKETTHTQHSHRHTTRVSVRVISAKDRPLPKGNVTPRPTQSAKGGQRAGDQQAGPRTAHSHNRTNQPTTSSSPRAAGGAYSAPSQGGEKATDSPARPPRGPTVRAEVHMHMLRLGVRDIATPPKGRPATGGTPAGRAKGVVSTRGNAAESYTP